jgi:DNA-binding transcriptional LysR family regulator
MRLRYIEMFQAVLQAETLTGAARLLNISQPAATKLLQQAERQLGFALFTRVRGRLRLTPEAVILRQRIERISDELNELKRLAGNLKPSERQVLRVVSTPTLANELIPMVITQVRDRYPGTEIDLLTQHTREMLNSLLLRESDIGLTLQRIDHPAVRCESLCEGSVMVIAQRGHWPEAEVGTPFGVERLAAARVVGIAVRDDLGRKLQVHLEHLSPPPSISTWVQTYQVARSLVAAGHGLAVVDPFTARGGSEDSIQVRPLDPTVAISLYAVYRLETELSTLQAAVIEHVQTLAETLLSRPSAERRRGS